MPDQEPIGELTEFQQSLQQLSALLLDAEPTLLLGLDWRIKDLNLVAEELCGWKREELLGRPFDILVPAQFHDQVEDLLARCAAGETIRKVESARENRARQVSPVSLTMTTVTNLEGEIAAVAVQAKDISEFKLLQARLGRMTKVFMDSADPMIIRNLQGRIIDVNDEVERTFGWSRDELIGKFTLHELPPDAREEANEMLASCLRGEPLRNYELEMENRRGERITVLFSLSLLTGELGEPFGIAQIFKNITLLKQATRELESRNRELENFAAVVAHDLQQPLSTIRGFSELLDQQHGEQLESQGRNFLAQIRQGIQQAQNLVTDLLKYACLDRAAAADPTNCQDALDAALSNLQPRITASNAAIESQPLPMALCNGTQLVQLFENLIGNALKYNRETNPQISISAERSDDKWVFCVADNGIGIDSEHHDTIFDIFSRLHTKDEFAGTGIGLAICRKIVERHGGRIWVRSEQNKGSRFYFTLPACFDAAA